VWALSDEAGVQPAGAHALAHQLLEALRGRGAVTLQGVRDALETLKQTAHDITHAVTR
jgi:hypothetical protein